jgi:hypothetical protein
VLVTDAAADPVAARFITGARMHQSALVKLRKDEKVHQRARDADIRSLRELDEKTWTYAAIAEEVGLTAVNVVKILRKD